MVQIETKLVRIKCDGTLHILYLISYTPKSNDGYDFHKNPPVCCHEKSLKGRKTVKITTESYKGIPVSIVGEAHSGGIWPTIISKIVNRSTLTAITDDSFHWLGEALKA